MFDKLKTIICQYVEVNPEDIKPESRFIEDLGFNSYDVMCMLGDAETEFDIEIANYRTVGEVLTYIEGLAE